MVYTLVDPDIETAARPAKRRTKPQGRVLLIIPCFNEAKSIGGLLDEIASLNLDCDALVIDDASHDETSEVAESRDALCVRLMRNLGIGGAVQTGIKYAALKGYDFCCQIDGDGQHPPDQVARMLAAYDRKPTNILCGSRYLTNDTFRSTWGRRLGARMIVAAVRLFFGVRVTDPTSGLRLMDRTAIEFFAGRYPHDFPEPISLAWALKEKMTVSEIAVQMRAREAGQSSIRGLKPVAYMLRVLGYIALARLGRRPWRSRGAR